LCALLSVGGFTFTYRSRDAMLSLVCFLLAFQATAAAKVDENKNRPVTKIINLLKDMQAQLAKEADQDEEVYEKVSCWCQTNDKDKTTAISDAESRIDALVAAIEGHTANSARLNTEIKNLDHEIARNQQALDKATGIRTKELAEFNGEEKDMLQSIGALKSAVTVLGAHNSFAQVPSDTLINIASMIQWQFHHHADVVAQIVTPAQRKAVTAFVQAPSDYFDADPTFKQSYAPQSGAIFGILKQMKETFESNLSQSQKEEMINQQAYQSLKAAKEDEIKAGEDQRDTKTQELADEDAANAQAKQDLEDTRNSLDADQKFLMNLKETCQNTDAEWAERQAARAEEQKGCSEALAILSSDDAHDTFTKTFNFVQVESMDRREQAAKILTAAATKFGTPQLAALATRVKLAAFAKVIEDIDGMVVDLKKEKADDIKQKDFCVEELNQNERETELKSRDIDALGANEDMLKENIDQLTADIARLMKEIAEMQTQLKRAGEDREAENSDFQMTVSDQRATQKLLNNALSVLQAVYAKKSFVQTQQPAGPPPPAGFKKYEQSGGAGGVLGMIEQVIADAKTMEAEAIKAETDSQKAYESFVKDSNNSIEEKTREMTSKSAEKAEAEQDKTSTSQDKESAMNEKQQLQNSNADLHKSCDFTMNNFEVKQAALEQETEALTQAKAVLKGMGGSFLQKRVA